jgi:hypothetical protein
LLRFNACHFGFEDPPLQTLALLRFNACHFGFEDPPLQTRSFVGICKTAGA